MYHLPPGRSRAVTSYKILHLDINTCIYVPKFYFPRLEKLEVDNDKLVIEILRLNQELTKLREENTSMRQQLVDNSQAQTYHRPRGQKS